MTLIDDIMKQVLQTLKGDGKADARYLAAAQAIVDIPLKMDVKGTIFTYYSASRFIEDAWAKYPGLPGDTLTETSKEKCIKGTLAALTAAGVFTDTVLFISDDYDEPFPFDVDDIDYVAEEIKRSERALNNLGLTTPCESDPKYKINRGSISDPITGEGDFDPLTHTTRQYYWTDLISPLNENITPSSEELLSAAWNLLTVEQRTIAEKAAKDAAVLRVRSK
jgi:hypothetical protein